MLNSYLHLILLSLAMFFGAFIAGNLPLMMTMSQRQLHSVNALGCGLLLGTAFAVIIPEGIESLFSERHSHVHSILENENHQNEKDEEHHGHDQDAHHDDHSAESLKKSIVGVSLLSGFMLMLLVDNVKCCGGMHLHQQLQPHGEDTERVGSQSPRAMQTNSPRSPRSRFGDQGDNSMIVPDDLEIMKLASEPPPQSRVAIARNHSSFASAKHKQATVTIGLIVHCLADGLALGSAKAATAAATSVAASSYMSPDVQAIGDTAFIQHRSASNLDLIVFFAIMLHKVPAAFSYTVYLRSTGLGTSSIRRTLVLFSSAAPTGALVSYPFLQPGFLVDEVNSPLLIGFFILFSAGTFLYISAVHILQEVKENSTAFGEIDVVSKKSCSTPFNSDTHIHSHSHAMDSSDIHRDHGHYHHHQHGKLQSTQLMLVLIGSCIPFLLTASSLHSHAHG